MRLLLTSGPTYEPIDAVRFIGNRSSGRVGAALGDFASGAGWEVTMLIGPNAITPSTPEIAVHRFQSTQDLQDLLDEHFAQCDCLIMAAAVADFRPIADEVDLGTKRRRSEESLTLQLEPTPDLLARVSAMATPNKLLVGFALEPRDRLIESARAKLARKKIDLIVANELETMDSDSIQATLIGNQDRGFDLHHSTDGTITKHAFAPWLIEHITPLIPLAQSRATDTESALNGQS